MLESSSNKSRIFFSVSFILKVLANNFIHVLKQHTKLWQSPHSPMSLLSLCSHRNVKFRGEIIWRHQHLSVVTPEDTCSNVKWPNRVALVCESSLFFSQSVCPGSKSAIVPLEKTRHFFWFISLFVRLGQVPFHKTSWFSSLCPLVNEKKALKPPENGLDDVVPLTPEALRMTLSWLQVSAIWHLHAPGPGFLKELSANAL